VITVVVNAPIVVHILYLQLVVEKWLWKVKVRIARKWSKKKGRKVLARGGAPDCHTAVPGSNPALFSPSRQTLSIPRWCLAWHSITGWPVTTGRGKNEFPKIIFKEKERNDETEKKVDGRRETGAIASNFPQLYYSNIW
jgi:hypothetical protein